MKYAFGNFTLDTDRCEVRRGDEVLPLRPKAYALLAFLLERPRKVATKDELLDAVWSGLHVSDDSLKQCVSELRQGLGAEAGRILRTVPRRGYMLESDVTQLTKPPSARHRPGRRAALFLGAVSLAGIAGFAATFLPAAVPKAPDSAMILDASRTAIGQRFVFPEGPGRVVSSIKVLQPGTVSEWHRHAHTLFAYVLRGTVVVDYGAKGVRTYSAGAAMLEAVDWPHQARNESRAPVEILVVELSGAIDEARETTDPFPAPYRAD